ncbi:hypothetical protein WAI453_004100 [Rhynchosporium graminicola]|uniref:Uncharacterized protein n=1 Tax=Rhynchosporium graminicola TaxID=2792576 RepID=A0A1E1JXJ5_9HELO|nr:uncharacterized protein RCO7_06836 [Rhynchosporium commune]
MKTVPSLVASSTVGIAAAGLALGKPERSSPRPSSKKRKAGDIAGVVIHNSPIVSSPTSRPGTTSTVVTSESKISTPALEPTPAPVPTLSQRPSKSRSELQNNNSGRMLSIFRPEDILPNSEEATRRESVSSRGSWMRRLSTIPNSHNNSPRSSVGPDSPSISVSLGSAIPILSNPGNSTAQLPPNKLVKRGPSTRASSGPVSRSGSSSHIPTLRRPATSHQRTVTLQQQFRDDSVKTQELIYRESSPRVHVTPSKNDSHTSRHAWRLYFESRPTKLSKDKASGRMSDGGIPDSQSTSRRIILDDSARPTLVKPGTIIVSSSASTYYDESFELDDDEFDGVGDIPLPSTEVVVESQKRARRSLSMHFSSPSSWIQRSGSLRDQRRGEPRSGGKRYSSAPVATMPGRSISTAHGSTTSRHRPIMDPKVFQRSPVSSGEASSSDPFAVHFARRSRNSSSPLPPLTRLSSFNVDLARLGLSSSSSSAPCRSPSSPVVHNNTNSVSSTGHASPASISFVGSANSKAPRTSELTDRASTLIGSDNDMKGFASGDEDDMDFQSETVFDSLRSGATGSLRSNTAPLESMFDESPPSLNGHSKNKRLSIHEMLANGGFHEGHNKIVEEDEGISTPIKEGRSSQDSSDNFQTPVRTRTIKSDRVFPASPPSFCLATKEFSRLSLDDEEEDEDWTRDDENIDISGQLSPPSSSLNSRRPSLSFRAALADLTHTGAPNGNGLANGERPKSNLFDWSEPPTAEKADLMGNFPRPKTAHAKQIADGRGGRAIGRRGPSPMHIRSQSVPVVPDVAGQRDSKLAPKFGTWGLGGKGVSEDWDGDFDFESNDADGGDDGDVSMENSGMMVPPAIQASQASVVGHVGQIREVCLLVEDLKRLRLLAREKGLLNGPSATLWKEAEGIIALAVPDDEESALSPTPPSPTSVVLEEEASEDDEFHESGPDAEDLEISEAPFEVLNRHGRPTGFVYDGNTVRRRSVFSPEDDIFGAGLMNRSPVRDHLRPPSTSPRHSSLKSASDVARSVMETMHQHRSTSDPILQNLTSESPNKMPFDTTSLRDLVHRANVLSRTLADLIRKADGPSQSPETSPRRDSSPAFTRVFTDPSVSPPKNLLRSHSNNSIISGSIDGSPTRSLGQRMHMMTVV